MSNIEDVSENAQTLETEGTTQEVKEVKSIDEPQDKVDDISSTLTTEYNVLPHHGSEGNSLNGFLGNVHAKIAIISSDPMEKQCYRNGFPRLSAVKKLCNTFEYEAENAHTLMCWNE